MIRKLLFSVILVASLLFFALFSLSPRSALAACDPATCTGVTTGPMCNGPTCATQGRYCSAGVCVTGWAGGGAASGCSPACGTPACNASNCSGVTTGPMCNGPTCATQGRYCSAGVCVTGWAGGGAASGCSPACGSSGGVCTPGQRQCIGGCSYQVCDSSGQWGASNSCPANSGCTTTTGTPSCQTSAAAQCGGCTQGERRCTGSCGYQVCNSLGEWGADQTCPTNPASGCVTVGGAIGASCQTSAAAQCVNSCAGGTCKTYSATDNNNGCGKTETIGEFCDAARTQICCVPKGGSGGATPDKVANPDCGYPFCNEDQGTFDLKCNGGSCDTALGPIGTTPQGLATSIFSIMLGIVGAIATLLIIISGYRIMASQGNPEKLQGAREQLSAAIVGLIFVILSFVILQTIGVDLLKLPGFAP